MLSEILVFTVGMVLVFGGVFACVAKFALLGKCKVNVSSRMNEKRFYEAMNLEPEKEEMEQKKTADYRKTANQIPSMSHS